ncbi:MAG: (E)-4-hydroxy-3-methylbut-2-enyl-diphosphate synthase [Planctomycetia bacterium]|nr:(E)-4-hydroxy-3-methylbut-2-enyl-diphosphate synthase [Planctomycetia bacterium]
MIRQTRKIRIGSLSIGGDSPIMIQSMCSTKTTDIESSLDLIDRLVRSGAGLVRLAVDNLQDVEALAEIRKRTTANLSVDLQENFRLAEKVAPFVDKIRYNPGHLFHLEPKLSWEEKVRYLADAAGEHDCALRIGVNCGSVDPNLLASFADGIRTEDSDPILQSALEHSAYLDSIGFTRYCVSIKDSDPRTVIGVNRRFAQLRPEIPLHLGVTEAGMPPWGVLKSRFALETLLSEGIGDTLRVSLTVPSSRKTEEVEAGSSILKNVEEKKILDIRSCDLPKLNLISCPSCSRVQNGSFIDLAERVAQAVEFAKDYPITIAIMGCRVNGPGESDNADIGLWCGPDCVNLKEDSKFLGSWNYDVILDQVIGLVKKKMEAIRLKNGNFESEK